MKLHYSPFSPFARIVRVVAHELNLQRQITLVQVEGLLPTAAHADLTRDNPLGKVPALVREDGMAIYDSRVIAEYLMQQAGDKSLLPEAPMARLSVKVLEALAQGILDAAVAHRYETFVRPEERRWPEYIARQEQRILDGVRACANYETLSLGSISLACALCYLDLRLPGLAWRHENAAVSAWHADFCKRPSMEQTKP